MPCNRFKRVRQAEVISPEVNAFNRKLKLTILMTLVTEKQHDHPEPAEVAPGSIVQEPMGIGSPIRALNVTTTDRDLLLEQLRARISEPLRIPRREA